MYGPYLQTLCVLVSFHVHLKQVQVKKKVKTQTPFSLRLSFTRKWEICQHQTTNGMPRSQSHTLDYGKPITA